MLQYHFNVITIGVITQIKVAALSNLSFRENTYFALLKIIFEKVVQVTSIAADC